MKQHIGFSGITQWVHKCDSLSQMYHIKRDVSTASSRAVVHGSVIKPTALLDGNPSTSYPYDVHWYDSWVRYQMKSQPQDLYSVLPESEEDRTGIPMTAFKTIWHEVCVQASKSNSSIGSIVRCLFDKRLVKLHDDVESLLHVTNLVFAIIGWQTMLYKPDIGSYPRAQLAIAEETDGHRGYAYMKLRQDQHTSKYILWEFLRGFGVLLPGCNFNTLASGEEKQALATIKTVRPDTFNMHLLTSVGNIQMKWTDSLSCHLEFDANSSMLYLFRFPTFCAINLLGREKDQPKPTIYSCAAPPADATYWATHEDINNLLQEILLSYRLLFGQDKASRRLFRSLNPFDESTETCKDCNLSELCGRKQPNIGLQLPTRDSYDLNKDFPILRTRLASLAHHFSNKRPRTWKELWNDKRDSASWFTFWAVLIIGGIGIILAFVQVILQIVQVSLQMKQL